MAEAAIEDSDCPEVEWLSRSMISSQKAEIRNMVDMLRERGAKPPSPEDSPMHDVMDMGSVPHGERG